MKRKLQIIRLMMCRGGYSRAKYLKKRRYFYHQGEQCFLTPCNYGTEPWLISMGNNVHVASRVSFVTHDVTFKMFQNMDKSHNYAKRVGTIEIGDNVFIGSNATILYDVKIGNNVIIAAGALVNSNIPDGTIYGGVPARKIGEFNSYMKKMQIYSKSITWKDKDSLKKIKKEQIRWSWKNE